MPHENMKDYSFRRIYIEKRSDVSDLLKKPLNDGLPRDKFAKIAERFPQYVKYGDSIQLERPQGHPDLEELLSYAQALGAIISIDASDTPSQVRIYDFPFYSRGEQLSAQLVECLLTQPVYSAIDSNSTEESLGLFYKNAGKVGAVHSDQFGSLGNLSNIIAVRGRAVEVLLAAKLKHLRLVPLATDAADRQWPGSSEPLFIIWSDYELPPLDMELFDNKGKLYRRGRSAAEAPKWVYAVDGYAVHPRLHWDRLEIGEFDIGRTRERLGGVEPFYHSLVYSQRARAVLEEIGMKLNLRPVVLRSSAKDRASMGVGQCSARTLADSQAESISDESSTAHSGLDDKCEPSGRQSQRLPSPDSDGYAGDRCGSKPTAEGSRDTHAMNLKSDDEGAVHHPAIGVDTTALANAVKEHVMASWSGLRRIDIWAEGGMPDSSHKQIGFAIWYTTRARRQEAFADGEAGRLEKLLRDECVKRGFPESQRERIRGDVDSHQALARLMGQEVAFKEWLENVDPQSLE